MTYYGNSRYAKFDELVGKKVLAVNIERDDYEDVIIIRTSPKTFAMYHDQDCCEQVEIKEIDNDISKLVGATIVEAEVATEASETDEGSMTWTFYKITTDKADRFTISWLGESNGYYSEEVTFAEIFPEEE